MSAGRLPFGLFIPITAGKGPLPDGRMTVEVSVSVFVPSVTTTVRRLLV